MVEKIEKSLLEVDFASLTRRTFTPSPAAWEDQVLYFLLLDRFSDGKEKDGYRDNADAPVPSGSTPLYRPEDAAALATSSGFKPAAAGKAARSKGCKASSVTSGAWASPPCGSVPFSGRSLLN